MAVLARPGETWVGAKSGGKEIAQAFAFFALKCSNNLAIADHNESASLSDLLVAFSRRSRTSGLQR